MQTIARSLCHECVPDIKHTRADRPPAFQESLRSPCCAVSICVCERDCEHPESESERVRERERDGVVGGERQGGREGGREREGEKVRARARLSVGG